MDLLVELDQGPEVYAVCSGYEVELVHNVDNVVIGSEPAKSVFVLLRYGLCDWGAAERNAGKCQIGILTVISTERYRGIYR